MQGYSPGIQSLPLERKIFRRFSLKENDHAMDDMRYFVSAVLTENRDDDFIAMSVLR